MLEEVMKSFKEIMEYIEHAGVSKTERNIKALVIQGILAGMFIAIGAINLTVNCTLSPGITISEPSGRETSPVTSVVRK